VTRDERERKRREEKRMKRGGNRVEKETETGIGAFI